MHEKILLISLLSICLKKENACLDHYLFFLSIQELRTNKRVIITGLLRQKDVEQALLLEEKITLQLKLLAAAGLDPPSPPSYRHLVSEKADADQMWKDVLTAVQVI